MSKQLCVIRDEQTEQRILVQYKLLLEAGRLASSRDIYNLLKKEYQGREIRNEEYCEETLDRILGDICSLSDEAGDNVYEMAFKNVANSNNIMLSPELLKHLEVLVGERKGVEQICFKDVDTWGKATIALVREGIGSYVIPLCALLLLEEHLDELGAAMFRASSAELECEEIGESYWFDELEYHYSEDEIGELFDGWEI